MLKAIPWLIMALVLPLHSVATDRTALPEEEENNPGTSRSASENKGVPYFDIAKECGVEKQQVCHTMRKDGSPVCGRAVHMMIDCMAKSFGIHGCHSNCGEGKSFVNCDQLKTCGYRRFSGNAKECTMPGAIRAYKKTHSTNGKKHGHVEFVCGEQYCSVYKQPFDEPWPTFKTGQKPDACWYPDPKKTGIKRK